VNWVKSVGFENKKRGLKLNRKVEVKCFPDGTIVNSEGYSIKVHGNQSWRARQELALVQAEKGADWNGRTFWGGRKRKRRGFWDGGIRKKRVGLKGIVAH